MLYFSKRGHVILIAGYSVWKVLIICVGIFIGSFVDAVGGGGGLITLPSYIIAGLPVHMALGTNKLSSCIGTSASTVRYIKNGYIDWVLALPSIALALAGSYKGTTLQLHIDEKYLKYVLLPVLVVTAVILIKKKSFPESAGDIARWKQMLIVWAAAFVLGAYDGFYGPGCGMFLLIIFCRLAKLDLRTAAGNVKAVNLSSNLSAVITSLIAGKVIVQIGLISAVFAVLGHYIGAGKMIKNGSKIVTPVILTVLALLFIKIVLELFGIGLPG